MIRKYNKSKYLKVILFTLILVLILPAINISLASGNGNYQQGMINSEIDTASKTGSGGYRSGSSSHDTNTEPTAPTDESTEHSGSGSDGKGSGSHDLNTEPTAPKDESTEHSGAGSGGSGSGTHDSNTEPTSPTDESTEHSGTGSGGSGSGTHDSDTTPTNDKGKGNGGGGGSHNDSTDSGKNGGSEGKVEITITVTGLTKEILVTLEKKVEEDEVTIPDTKTTVDGEAVFLVDAGGSCTVNGEDVPGYFTPAELFIDLTGIKGNFSIDRSLDYEIGTDSVTGIELDKEEIVMFEGFTKLLTATVSPSTAEDQSVIWSTNDETVATVDDGLITAISEGSAQITASSDSADLIQAICNVTVLGVSEVLDSTINGFTGEIITLPTTVEISASDGDSYSESVTWYENGEEILSIVYYTAGIYDLTGRVIGNTSSTSLEASLSIDVSGPDVAMITRLSLDARNMELYVGETETLSIIDKEDNVNYQTLIWNNTDSYVASFEVDPGGDSITVTGIAEGNTFITVRNFEGTIYKSCYIQVSTDPTLTDPVYIMGTTYVEVDDDPISISDFENVDQYETAEDVYILAYNLPFDGTYNIKIEDKGSAEPLYTGTFVPSEHQITIEGEAKTQTYFRLIDVLDLVVGEFELSDNLSNSYFVSISTDPLYPSGDYGEDDGDASGTPITLVDNFKITSPVPTVPKEDIRVTLQQQFDDHIGPIIDTLFIDDIGPDVLLARELDMSAEDTHVDDYYTADYIEYLSDPSHEFTSKYTDEVKLIGHVLPANDTADYNEVLWHEPKETIKIGGYILLIELPTGYGSNLDMMVGEDGADLKEIHLTRNYSRTIEVIIWEE